MTADATLPNDYLERVYAGVLGKLIGVYLGRPFEGWTYRRIMEELGPITGYVHERLGQPLVVTDDDVAGTFTFLRALEDHRLSPDLSAAEIGETWLNYLIENRTILWWGGNGMSTEHTAWLNLSRGIPAPSSGSIATNGSTVAEQIGAQIFIDGWAMVAPGQPRLAATLAQQAASVSHDGEAVYAAMLWAAMEAEAFRSADIDHLIDTGLSVVPPDSLIARVIADVRRWHGENPDWRTTRQLIEDNYGYDKFPGNCHVVPNHAVMIMAALYAPDDFDRAQMIVNTSGWDTDCNAANVGCLLGLMLGLDAIDRKWRDPIADRMLISSADGGNSINDAVRTAYRVASLGARLAGGPALALPKNGAQLSFSLPGSVQGFRPLTALASVDNVEFEGSRALSIAYDDLVGGQTAAAVTPVFAPPDVANMRTYELTATPLVNSGQVITARVVAPAGNTGAVAVRLRLRVYGGDDALHERDGEPVTLPAGAEYTLTLTVPTLGGQPLGEIGIAIAPANGRADGNVLVDYVRWDGPPKVELRKPADGGTFWRRAWVNGVSTVGTFGPNSFRINQSQGEGLYAYGTREWTDYTVAAPLAVNLGDGGLALRVQGMRRYYAVRLCRRGALQITRMRDGVETVLAECPFPFALDRVVELKATIRGTRIEVDADNVRLSATDETPERFADGGIALLVRDGMLSCDVVRVTAAS